LLRPVVLMELGARIGAAAAAEAATIERADPVGLSGDCPRRPPSRARSARGSPASGPRSGICPSSTSRLGPCPSWEATTSWSSAAAPAEPPRPSPRLDRGPRPWSSSTSTPGRRGHRGTGGQLLPRIPAADSTSSWNGESAAPSHRLRRSQDGMVAAGNPQGGRRDLAGVSRLRHAGRRLEGDGRGRRHTGRARRRAGPGGDRCHWQRRRGDCRRGAVRRSVPRGSSAPRHRPARPGPGHEPQQHQLDAGGRLGSGRRLAGAGPRQAAVPHGLRPQPTDRHPRTATHRRRFRTLAPGHHQRAHLPRQHRGRPIRFRFAQLPGESGLPARPAGPRRLPRPRAVPVAAASGTGRHARDRLGTSADRDAVSLVRMQLDLQNRGYAAGVAAAMAAQLDGAVRSIDIRQLQQHLVEHRLPGKSRAIAQRLVSDRRIADRRGGGRVRRRRPRSQTPVIRRRNSLPNPTWPSRCSKAIMRRPTTTTANSAARWPWPFSATRPDWTP
jgi:hypothetical protein